MRDQIRALEATLEGQQVVSDDFVDQDVIGFHREATRGDRRDVDPRRQAVGQPRVLVQPDQEFPDAELIVVVRAACTTTLGASVPDEVLLPVEHRGRGAEGASG